MKKDIRQKEKEMFLETWRLKRASLEVSKTDYERSRKIQEKENELYKKQQFFRKMIKEMEKEK